MSKNASNDSSEFTANGVQRQPSRCWKSTSYTKMSIMVCVCSRVHMQWAARWDQPVFPDSTIETISLKICCRVWLTVSLFLAGCFLGHLVRALRGPKVWNRGSGSYEGEAVILFHSVIMSCFSEVLIIAQKRVLGRKRVCSSCPQLYCGLNS